MSILSRIVKWFLDYLNPQWPSPALHGMSLGHEQTKDNPLMIQFFTWDSKCHNKSWWKHFEDEVPGLTEMGFTQAWLPPPNKAMNKNGRGYDAYDLWDLGEFDQKNTIATRWGTKEELLSASAVANGHGIHVIIDAHKLGADRCERFPAVPVDSNNRTRDIGPPQEIEGWTAFDFPGRQDKYSSMHWTHEHFTGVDWDNLTRTSSIFRIPSSTRKGWSQWVDKELGNYDYLMGADIDHTHPEVYQDIMAWGSWILETTGASGFRLDAVKHLDRRFLLQFLLKVRQALGKEKLFAVAEYWSPSLKLILPYIKAFDGQLAFFDVPLHFNFHRASKLGNRFDLRTVLDNTIMKQKPGDAVTFVDNHDTQIGQSLESWVGDNFKLQSYALILLREEGHPCVFYGDLYPNEECYNRNIAAKLRSLIEIRKRFAYGATADYFQSRNCIGFVRMGNAEHAGCAVLISNIDPGMNSTTPAIRMNVGMNGQSKYQSYMNSTRQVPIDADGWGTFTCPLDGVEVWIEMNSV